MLVVYKATRKHGGVSKTMLRRRVTRGVTGFGFCHVRFLILDRRKRIMGCFSSISF